MILNPRPNQITTTTEPNSDYSGITASVLPGFVPPSGSTNDQLRSAVQHFINTKGRNVQSFNAGKLRD